MGKTSSHLVKKQSAKKTLSESNSRTRAQCLSSHRISVHRVCHVSVHRLHQVLVQRDVECQYVELSRVSVSSSTFVTTAREQNFMNFYDTNRRKNEDFYPEIREKLSSQNIPPNSPSLSANVKHWHHPLTNVPP